MEISPSASSRCHAGYRRHRETGSRAKRGRNDRRPSVSRWRTAAVPQRRSLLSGGNVDPNLLAEILTETL